MSHRVIVKAPGEHSEFHDPIVLDYRALTGFVGGYLEPVPLPAGLGALKVGMYCNEYSATREMERNFMVRGTWVCGPVVLFSIVGTQEYGLNAGQILSINEAFGWDHLTPSLRVAR